MADEKPKEELLDPGVKKKLIITLFQDGKVGVEGPLNDEPLVLWLLEKAKDGIKAMHTEPSKIIQPRGGIMNFARKKRF